MKHARPDYDRIQDPAELIPAEEPVFLIRGQDVAGPVTLRYWATAAKSMGADQEIIDLVLDQAKAMEDWQATQVAKIPDLPKGADHG